MGNRCGCAGADELGNFDIEGSLGYDDTNVHEEFQHHEHKLDQKDVTLSYYDKVYRHCCHPLHLMQLEEVWQELDAVCEASGPVRVDSDFVPIAAFTVHLSRKKPWEDIFQEANPPFLTLLRSQFLRRPGVSDDTSAKRR